MTDVVLDVSDLRRIYRADDAELAVRAVDGVSFRVNAGESVAIVGASGCGKSTLLQILGCLDRPTSGRYALAGSDVSRLDEDALAALRNRHVGFVFQSFHLLPRLSAVENVALPLLYGPHLPDAHERALAALTRVGLGDRAHHLPAEMSGGQRQRTAIARALVTRPSLLLCDEPTGALDTRTSDDVLALIDDIHRQGATIVMVTHDVSVARRMERVIWMSDGRIERDGPSEEVLDAFVARLSARSAAA
ncbi:MAG: ABC transporter ATP-binding protein [Deltaproteobacteria bacterium]|nr:ABC transporter ATP-binding protein [Deltaproteobacteria bacterium]